MLDIELKPGEKKEVIFDSIDPWERNSYGYSFNYMVRDF